MGGFESDESYFYSNATTVKKVATPPVHKEPPTLSLDDLPITTLPPKPTNEHRITATTFETWAPQWVRDAITFTGESFSAAEIMSRAHNARSVEYLPTDDELQWAMEHAITHEQDGYWKTSYAHVVPEFAGGLIGDFQSNAATAGLKFVGAAAAGTAAHVLTGMAFEAALTAALGFAVGGPAGAAIGAASVGRRAYMVSKLAKVINGIFKGSSATVAGAMTYSALDKLAYVPLQEKEERGIMEPNWEDVALSGLEVSKDLPLILGSGFALGAIGKGFGNVFNKVTAQNISNNQAGFVIQTINQHLSKHLDILAEERAGSFAHDPNEPLTAKYGLLDALGKDLYAIKDVRDPVTGEVTYEFEGKQKTTTQPKGKALTSTEDLHAHVLAEHIDRMADLNTPQEMARYITSQMLDTGTTAEMYKSMMHNALFKDMNISENAILNFHELFGYNEELNNKVGDYVRELNNVISKVSTELTDKIKKLKTGLTAEEFIKKIGDNIKQVNKLFLSIAHELGIEAQPLVGWTPQSHDPHSINKAGFNKWYQTIITGLDEQKTFIDPHDKAVSERHAEIQAKEAEKAAEYQIRKKRAQKLDQRIAGIRRAYEDKSIKSAKSNMNRARKLFNKISAASSKAIAKARDSFTKLNDIAETIRDIEDAIENIQAQESVAMDAIELLKGDIAKEARLREAERRVEEAKRHKTEAVNLMHEVKQELKQRIKQLKQSIKEAREQGVQPSKSVKLSYNLFKNAVDRLDDIRNKARMRQIRRSFSASRKFQKMDTSFAARSAARVARKIAKREQKGLYMRKWNDLKLWEQLVIKRDFLKSAYDNIALKDGQIDGAQVGSSARTFKQGRVLHFKNEEAFRNYSKEFGRKVNSSILARYLDYIERYANNSALREKFGPTPGKAIDEMRNYIFKKGGGEDAVSKLLLNLGRNWQNATMNGGSVFTDPKRASLSRGLFKVADDTLRAYRTKGSYVYSLIQEPIMALIAKRTYMGKNIAGMVKAFKELATNGMNNRQLRYIGLLGDFITTSRDMLDNDIQTYKDAKSMKAALKVRNAMRAMHLGTTISERNREITHLSAQFGFGEALSMGKVWHELPKQWRRLFRLAGLSEADFNIANKYKDILLSDGAQIPETKKYGDVKLMNWTQAIRNIENRLAKGTIHDKSAKRLEIIARKFGKAQYKLVERVVAQGDKASSAFVGITGYNSFWNRLMPYMSWSVREMANFIENGDWRIPEGAGATGAIGWGFAQRLIIGSLITMVKLGEKGRLPHLHDEENGINFENLASFLGDVIYHGGVTQLFGQGTDNIFKSIMNEGTWRSPEDVGTTTGRLVAGEVGAYTGAALMRIAHVLYAMSQNDINKAKRQAFGFIPNAPDWIALNLLAHRLMIDPILSDLSPVYENKLRRDAENKRNSYAPYFLATDY